MDERIVFSRWSTAIAFGWQYRLETDTANEIPIPYVVLKPPTNDSSLRLTPDDRGFDAAKWVEAVFHSHRLKGRPVSAVQFKELSGCFVEYASHGEWSRGWALASDSHPLDATYRCSESVAGRDDKVVESMLNTLRLELV